MYVGISTPEMRQIFCPLSTAYLLLKRYPRHQHMKNITPTHLDEVLNTTITMPAATKINNSVELKANVS